MSNKQSGESRQMVADDPRHDLESDCHRLVKAPNPLLLLTADFDLSFDGS